MQRNILSGSEFLLYNINDQAVAYSKNCAISINQNLTDVTTKNSDSWSEYMVGIKDWSIEFEGLVSYGDGFSSNYFFDKYQNREPFFIKFGVVQENFTHAFSGEVYIGNINQSGEIGEVATFSGSLKGVGNLSFTDEGSPEQSGYLKTETDPVFRGSPAYGITDTDKAKWSEANNKIVQEIQFVSSGSTTTLKMKFLDGNQYSTSFQNINSVDLSGYYTKGEADTRIATAQVAADNANTLLFNIAADFKLTPNEKINVLKEWQIIQNEMPNLVQQAVDADVPTLDYDVAYIELEEFLDPLLISMVSTSDLQGYELRDMFKAYYNQKLKLQESISKAAIRNIKIGSRNFHLKGDKNVLVYSTVNQILQAGNYPVNSEMALSFSARSIDGTSKLYLEFAGKQGESFDVPAIWRKFSCVLKTGDIPTLYARIGQFLSVLNLNIFDPKVYPSFPYLFPMMWDETSESNGIELKDIMVVLGNKATDFVPAPEDFYDRINAAKLQATEASNEFALAQRLLAETNSNAYADGIVTDLEQANISLATSNLQVAKQYADTVALNAKVLAQVYADGKIDEFESLIIDSSDTNIELAKAYTDSQRALSEVVLKSYADGVVSDVEAVLIDNATHNLEVARQYAQAQDLLTKTLVNAYSDQKISIEESARIAAVQASLDAAKLYTVAQRELSEVISKSYADGVVDAEEARAIADAQAKLNAAKAYADQKALDLKSEIITIVDQSIVAKANEIIANTTTQINVANTATLQSAASDAEAKATIARNAAIASSNSYSQAQIALSEVTQQALLDGKISAEEQARINQAANNLQAAKDDSTVKANSAAQYGIAAQNLHNALVGNLKSLAYVDVVEVSKLGSTIVQGGMIRTSLIDANYIKSDIINSTYIQSLGITATNIATSATGKRIVIDGIENNIRLFDSSNNLLALLDDDSAIEGGYSNTTAPTFPYPRNYLGSFFEGNTQKYNYATMGAGLSIGLNPIDSGGFLSLGRKGLTSYGGAIQVKPTQGYSGASTTIDFAGINTTGTILTYGNLRVEGSITVGSGFNSQNGITWEGDVRMGGGDFYRMKWVNGILVSSVRQ